MALLFHSSSQHPTSRNTLHNRLRKFRFFAYNSSLLAFKSSRAYLTILQSHPVPLYQTRPLPMEAYFSMAFSSGSMSSIESFTLFTFVTCRLISSPPRIRQILLWYFPGFRPEALDFGL